MERIFTNRPARLTFTSDFHELLRGDLRPGCDLLLRYDPKRIVPEGEPYVFGDPNAPIVAHASFHEGEPPVSKPVVSESGVIEDPIVDVTGQGSMLTASFNIPENADEVILWFSYASLQGGMHYDSDGGRNFRFSFPSRELRVVAADVVTNQQTHESAFSVDVACSAEVQRVLVRVRAVKNDDFKKELELTGTETTGDDPQGWPHWKLGPTPVPFLAVIEFKVYYWMRNVRYKDDNSGRYYLVPVPTKGHVPPPPPKELAAAAQKWGKPPTTTKAGSTRPREPSA